MAYEIEERHGAGESGEIRNRSVRPDKWKSSCFPFLTIADRRPMVTRLCQPRKPISIFFPGHFHLSIETYDTFDHRRFLTAKIKKVPFNSFRSFWEVSSYEERIFLYRYEEEEEEKRHGTFLPVGA